MTSGRQVRLVGKRMVINLNNKGGVRKSPRTNAYASCVATELSGKTYASRAAQRSGFRSAASKCKGKKG